MRPVSEAQKEELAAIHKANRGKKLMPADVVAFARNPKSALHSRFTWDNRAAADRYRILEARWLIEMVKVSVLGDDREPVRVYVSLAQDRENARGGYRGLDDVLRNAQLRDALLGEALEDLRRVEERYGRLTELAAVFAEADRVRRKSGRRNGSAGGRKKTPARRRSISKDLVR